MNRIREQLAPALLVLAGTWLLGQALPVDAGHAAYGHRLSWLSCQVTLVGCLVLLPGSGSAVVNGLVGGIVFLVLATMLPALPNQATLLAGVSVGIAILLYALTAMTSLLGRCLQPRPVAAWIVLLAVGLLASATIWSGPLVDSLSPGQPTIDAIVASSPLTYLASLAGWDYLRDDWFYRHTPFGGLRYDYPSAFTSSLFLAGTGLACELAGIRLDKGPRRSPALSTPQSPHQGDQACSTR